LHANVITINHFIASVAFLYWESRGQYFTVIQEDVFKKKFTPLYSKYVSSIIFIEKSPSAGNSAPNHHYSLRKQGAFSPDLQLLTVKCWLYEFNKKFLVRYRYFIAKSLPPIFMFLPLELLVATGLPSRC